MIPNESNQATTKEMGTFIQNYYEKAQDGLIEEIEDEVMHEEDDPNALLPITQLESKGEILTMPKTKRGKPLQNKRL